MSADAPDAEPPSPDAALSPAPIEGPPTTSEEPPPRAGSAPPDMRRRAMRSSVFTLVGHGAGNLIRLGSNLLLTAWLVPEYFGVMALVNIFLQGLHMFSDVGIGTSIIQSPRGEDPAFINTAFSVQALRGVYLFVVSCALGPLLAWFYGISELTWMVPIAATTALLDGVSSTSLFTQNRSLTLGKLTVVELASQLVGTATMLLVAYFTRSVVALLVSGIAGGIVRTVLSHTYLPGIRNRFAWDADARKDLLTFGRWVFLSTAITFVALQIDRLSLGRLVSEAELGVYSIALQLAIIPREVVSQLSQRVYYPVVARTLAESGDRALVRRLRRNLALLLVVPVACTLGVADPLIRFLYDSRYHGGAPIMAWLTVGTWIAILESLYGAVALSVGAPRYITYGTLAKTIVFGVLVVPVFHAGGVVGVAALTSLAGLALYGMNAAAARREGVAQLGYDLAMTLAVLVIAYGAYRLHGLVDGALAPVFGDHTILRRSPSSLVGIVVLGIVALGVPGALLASRKVRLL